MMREATQPSSLTATRLKITIVLNAAELAAIPVPQGKPRAVLRIKLPERLLTADIERNRYAKYRP
jgi:hypothetical protein